MPAGRRNTSNVSSSPRDATWGETLLKVSWFTSAAGGIHLTSLPQYFSCLNICMCVYSSHSLLIIRGWTRRHWMLHQMTSESNTFFFKSPASLSKQDKLLPASSAWLGREKNGKIMGKTFQNPNDFAQNAGSHGNGGQWYISWRGGL